MKEGRREGTRYTARPGVLYVYAPSAITLWEIKDIGKGGLAFEYHPIPGEEIETRSIEIAKICDGQFRLSVMPCKVTYDIATLSQGQGFRGTKCRRRGLNYEKLTEMQNRDLDTLLESMLLDDRSVTPGTEFGRNESSGKKRVVQSLPQTLLAGGPKCVLTT